MVLAMQTDALFWDSLVFAGISEVEVEAVTAAFGTVEVVARGRAGGAACPDCGRFSGRVHDRYQRRLRDLPLADDLCQNPLLLNKATPMEKSDAKLFATVIGDHCEKVASGERTWNYYKEDDKSTGGTQSQVDAFYGFAQDTFCPSMTTEQ